MAEKKQLVVYAAASETVESALADLDARTGAGRATGRPWPRAVTPRSFHLLPGRIDAPSPAPGCFVSAQSHWRLAEGREADVASRRMFRHTARFVRWRPGRDRRSAPAARLRACPDLNAG
jgi:hypothetical protein